MKRTHSKRMPNWMMKSIAILAVVSLVAYLVKMFIGIAIG